MKDIKHPFEIAKQRKGHVKSNGLSRRLVKEIKKDFKMEKRYEIENPFEMAKFYEIEKAFKIERSMKLKRVGNRKLFHKRENLCEIEKAGEMVKSNKPLTLKSL